MILQYTLEKEVTTMNLKISAVCNNEESAKALTEAGKQLGYEINCEVQEQNKIKNKLSNENIKSSNAILFVTDKSVEDIEEIERFIDCEYYEVEPKFVIENPINVINEIATDLN